MTGRDAIEKMLRDNVIVHADGTPRTKHVTTNLAIEVDEEPGCRHPPQDDRLEHPRSRIESASDGSALRDPPTAREGGAKLLAAPACSADQHRAHQVQRPSTAAQPRMAEALDDRDLSPGADDFHN